jgi:hypothetical protein
MVEIRYGDGRQHVAMFTLELLSMRATNDVTALMI